MDKENIKGIQFDKYVHKINQGSFTNLICPWFEISWWNSLLNKYCRVGLKYSARSSVLKISIEIFQR